MDIISAIEFDKTGDHLATGDRGGRVVLFQRSDGKDVNSKSLDQSIVITCHHFCLCANFVHDLIMAFLMCAMQLWSRKELERTDLSSTKHPEYHYKTEFQSHEPEVVFRTPRVT